MIRAFLRLYSDPERLRGFRNLSVWILFLTILAAIPRARVLLLAGMLGGVVVGAALIIARHHWPSGPRRGAPIVLFPRPINVN